MNAMNKLKPIRELLGVTQHVLAEGIGCTQGNYGFYERDEQEFRPERARLLIEFAKKYGVALTFDHIYGDAPLPERVAATESAQQSA